MAGFISQDNHGNKMVEGKNNVHDFIVDESRRIRIFHPSELQQIHDIATACNTFRSNILHFYQASKQVLDQVKDHSQKVEALKEKATESRCLVALEIASRPHKLSDQKEEILGLQEKIEKLNMQYKTLLVVKQEQEFLLAQLMNSHAPS